MVAPAGPGGLIARGEQGFRFGGVEPGDDISFGSRGRDRQDALDHRRVLGVAQRGVGEQREFEIGDQTRLTYTRRVLQALRLRQPILVISRRARCDTQLRSLSIPAGSELFYSPYGLHRDPRHFPEPHRFDPDRWLVTPAGTLPRGAYVPFGGGPRRCIGEQFAWVMMAVVVVEVIRRWRLRLPPGFRVREMPWATVNPRSLPMTVHPAAAVVPPVHP